MDHVWIVDMQNQVIESKRGIQEDVPAGIKSSSGGDGATCLVDTVLGLVDIGKARACPDENRGAGELLLERVDIAEVLTWSVDAREKQDFRLIDREHRILDVAEQALGQRAHAVEGQQLLREVHAEHVHARLELVAKGRELLLQSVHVVELQTRFQQFEQARIVEGLVERVGIASFHLDADNLCNRGKHRHAAGAQMPPMGEEAHRTDDGIACVDERVMVGVDVAGMVGPIEYA